MSKLIGFFLAGPTAPARITALLAVAAIAAAGVLGLYTWGVYWRGEYREAKASLVALEAQSKILAGEIRACSTAAKETSEAAVAAVAIGEQLLEEAQALNKGGRRTLAKADELLSRTPSASAGCEDAWKAIEKARAAP